MGHSGEHIAQDGCPGAAGTPDPGEPVVEEGFHTFHPEENGWNLERWLLAVPGDGDADLGQFAAGFLQEHLDSPRRIRRWWRHCAVE